MIIDKKRKVICLHNPKSGGSFLRKIYIEKYGETDATQWWLPYTRKNGTDLGHISYDDLPRFIPNFQEYRLFVMVRNPYNRFVSAFKETKKHFHLLRNPYKPSFYYSFEYIEMNRKDKAVTWLKNNLPFTYLQELSRIITMPVSGFCENLVSFKKAKQDYILRNKRLPWLNPQSDFVGPGVTVLYYESVSDWNILFDAFGLTEFSHRLSIAKDYEIEESVCRMIEKLYPEDKDIFDRYNPTI